MAEAADYLVLDYLRRFDRRLTDFDAKLDRALEDLHTLKTRVSAVEENLVCVHRKIDRLERIEQRLDLVEPSHG
jgi:hypothetical protein